MYNTCMKLVKVLTKHRFLSTLEQHSDDEIYNEINKLLFLVSHTIPTKIHQFKVAAIDPSSTDTFLLKRLYLIKCEYRTPFRSFLEAHSNLQRVPKLKLLEEYLSLEDTEKQGKVLEAEEKFQSLLTNEVLKEALMLEQQCECVEVRRLI